VLTNDEGLLLIGGPELPGVDLLENLDTALLPFGENAVALYQGGVETLDVGGDMSSLSELELLDALVYETGPSENHMPLWSLMSCCDEEGGDGFSGGPVVNELLGEEETNYSIQRCPENVAVQDSRSWGLGPPTSGAGNDCGESLDFEGDCVFSFDISCPTTVPQCGATIGGEAGCSNTGEAICMTDGLLGLEVQSGELLTINFDPPIVQASLNLVVRSADSGEAVFYNSEGDIIILHEATLFCEEDGSPILPTDILFESPVSEIHILVNSGAAWLTDLTVTR
jgi:hypothetical protein